MNIFPDTNGLKPLISRSKGPLNGVISVPGDKSMSHRALMLAASAIGKTRIDGLLEGDDVIATANALAALGTDISNSETGVWIVNGVGVGGFIEPNQILDMGNAGTSARLMMGLISGNPITAFMTGDSSLRQRPMKRVTDPLKTMGAQIFSRKGGYLPLGIRGTLSPLPIEYELKVPSAQVKSSLFLCGLSSAGNTIINEPVPSRDHTEQMLQKFGANITTEIDSVTGYNRISLVGQPELKGTEIRIPGDFSSAAFPIAASLIIPGSDITLKNVGINPLRKGLLEALNDMGADITVTPVEENFCEPTANIRVKYSQLNGVVVPPNLAPSMIDEYPILAIIASYARGKTQMRGISELRLKESDRIASITHLLRSVGVLVEEYDDGIVIEGNGDKVAGGSIIKTQFDHRIAMSAIIMGMASKSAVSIDDSTSISTSFPGFIGLMNSLGSDISYVTK